LTFEYINQWLKTYVCGYVDVSIWLHLVAFVGLLVFVKVC